jgi:hypothetical protein
MSIEDELLVMYEPKRVVDRTVMHGSREPYEYEDYELHAVREGEGRALCGFAGSVGTNPRRWSTLAYAVERCPACEGIIAAS